MSNDHKANAIAAAAALGIDPAALHRIAQPPARADAAAAQAPAAPSAPNGGLRELAGMVASGARNAVRRLAKPVEVLRPNEPPPLPARALPSFLTAVRLSGGAETLGSSLRDVVGIAPRWLTSSGDVTVSIVPVSETHRLVPSVTMRRVLEALPRTTPLEPETNAAIVASLLALVADETTELRDELMAEMRAERIDYRYADEVRRRFEWLLIAHVQEKALAPDVAAHEVWRAFHSPVQRGGGLGDGGRPAPLFVESTSFRGALLLLQQCRITKMDLLDMAVAAAKPGAWILDGRAHARAVAAHDSKTQAVAKAKTVAEERERFLKTARVCTPKSAGLIIARRMVNAAKGEPFTLPHVAPEPEIRFGNYAYLIGARRWPTCIDMPSAIVATERNGSEITYEVLADDAASLELTEQIIERGQRARAPRWVLDGVLAAARERVASKSPAPVTKWIDARDKQDLRKRMAIFRAHLDTIADIFAPGFDVHTAGIDLAVAIQFGVIGCRIDPAIVAGEIGKRQKGADIPAIAESGFAVCRNPKLYAFLPDAGVEA